MKREFGMENLRTTRVLTLDCRVLGVSYLCPFLDQPWEESTLP